MEKLATAILITSVTLCFLLPFKTFAAPLIVSPGDLGSFIIEVDLDFDGVTRRFQLDTGADSTMVPMDETTRAYTSEGTSNSAGAAGSRITCDLIRPALLTMTSFADGFSQLNPKIKRCDFKGIINNLGIDQFVDRVFEFQFSPAKNEILFPQVIAKRWKLYPLTRLAKGHLKVPVEIANVVSTSQYFAILDTGAQLTSVDLSYVTQNPTLFKFVQDVETGTDVTGKPILLKIYEMSEFRIASVVFKNVQVAAFDFGELRNYLGVETPLIVGANAIVQANWLLDLKNDQWSVEERSN